ncbi:MAG: hypothetical protein KIC88_05875 [Acinetobacter sp.]|nr:hypothetical protein [Acinetobacter sp.]DAB10988.1 MAG TPA: hypothetical protein CPT91_07390 [Candidatus Gastranaerophilales bacterium HUM_16]DAB15971.1 MAG TPA: hypothetical protein CPT98_08580 [Candidatus Gastranaerophilales bacterium HUM_19]DAB17712.1 MAG TPA: hypothetical protein CPT97_04865 [Candidatus Gastranaerophilales bacterium HUM_17]DAB26912.1 MAG TPA: hypothetical protein CPT86_00975 [Candidatus Gastranaerophilales bacterium HUM_23]
MKISSINSQIQLSKKQLTSKDSKQKLSHKNQQNGAYNPSFKSIGMSSVLDLSSFMMQWIESKGYLVSFLIQDGLGMTAPRVWTGFHRDKEITGEYNVQEGLEVLGREGITGPYIIGVAPAILALTGKFCKSTNTNTRLIKRLGANLKEMISKPEFDKSIKNDAQKFKKEFYKYNLSKIYKDTVPNDTKSEETINYLVAEFEKYNSKDKKASKEALNNIVEKINNKMVENSDSLYSINKLYVGTDSTKTAFSSGEVIRALKDFGEDAIANNSAASSIDASAVDNIKNNFAAKRLLTNIANIVVTLGGLSILPKLYAPSDVAPGAKTMAHLQHKDGNNNTKDASNPSFKGKGINTDGFFAKFGKLITKYTPEKLHELLEYTGYNFSKTTFALLATLGLLLPRGKRAWDRAQIDENGKRDMTEINEILLRDTVSSLSVVFAVPLLTKMMVRSYEDKLGFILTNRASDGKNAFRRAMDVINPYSDLEVLSVADLDAIYGNIDSKAKLLNFSKFVNSKGGDLEKIISKSENSNVMFNDKTFTLESIKNLSKAEKNKKIIELFERIDEADPHVKEGISKLMKGSGNIKHNKIAKMARGLNSLPGFISTVFISPVLLGILIPMLTYHNTRKANAKKMAEKQA